MKDDLGVSKGFGFVSFQSPQEGATSLDVGVPSSRRLITRALCHSQRTERWSPCTVRASK
jgi:hypothetical protein